MSPGAQVLRLGLLAYRRAVSPLLGPRCRFEPSCSTYALEALQVHGAFRGSRLTLWRLLRCQPFGTPGFDPVPPLRAPRPHAWHRRIKPDQNVRPKSAQVSDLSGSRPTQGVRAC